jgi:hypothetical protein
MRKPYTCGTQMAILKLHFQHNAQKCRPKKSESHAPPTTPVYKVHKKHVKKQPMFLTGVQERLV